MSHVLVPTPHHPNKPRNWLCPSEQLIYWTSGHLRHNAGLLSLNLFLDSPESRVLQCISHQGIIQLSKVCSNIRFQDVPVTTSHLSLFGPRKRVNSRLHNISQCRETSPTHTCAPPSLVGHASEQKMLYLSQFKQYAAVDILV